MNFAFDPAAQTSLPIVGSEKRFPVNRVFCVGRNYGDHAREMGHDPDREPPFFFMKPSDAVCDFSQSWPYPRQTENVHYECELIVYMGKSGNDISLEQASAHIFGFGIGLDMTRRDLQGQAKKMGRPWEWGKAFDKSAPCGPVHRVTATNNLLAKMEKGAIWLKVNGQEKQRGDIGELIWSVREVISIISQSMAVKAGDVIMTGTPAGVGPVVRGDQIIAGIDELGDIALRVV